MPATAPLLIVAVLLSACTDRRTGEMQGIDTLARDTTVAVDTSGQTIYARLQDDPRFSMFVSVIDSAGVGETLNDTGPFTLFAPTNDAFAGAQDLLPSDGDADPRGLVLYHISNGETMSSDLLAGAIVRTLEGTDLSVSGSGDSLSVGGAHVIEADIDASNGVIHAIDRVLRLDGGA
jgi:uncharacterized surface protein with fasciclin (FAS1) repeats